MNKPTITTHNTETNKLIEREMTDQEFATYQADKAKVEADALKAQAKATAKAALLDRLGITADEAKLLLS